MEVMCQLGSHCGAFRWKANGWPVNRLAESSAIRTSPQHWWFGLVTGTTLGGFANEQNGGFANELAEGSAIPAHSVGGAG